MAGDVPANRIAKWDGTRWSTLASGLNNAVRPLEVFNDQLYVGGLFTSANSGAAKYLAASGHMGRAILGPGLFRCLRLCVRNVCFSRGPVRRRWLHLWLALCIRSRLEWHGMDRCAGGREYLLCRA